MAKQNFELFRGDDLRVFVPVVDEGGDAVDLTGATSIRWWAANSVNSAPVIQKDLDDMTLTGSGSTFYFDLSSDETELLSPRTYYHEAEIISSEGKVYTVMHGSMKVQKDLIVGESS